MRTLLSRISLSIGLMALPYLTAADETAFLSNQKTAQFATTAPQEAVYIDFGMSFSTCIWSYITWWPEPAQIQRDRLDNYLHSLFEQMKQAGQQTVYISFAQLNNLEYYYNETYDKATQVEAAYDTLIGILKQLKTSKVQVKDYRDFLDYFVGQAHKDQMKVALSFGGATAGDPQCKILKHPGDTYAGQAKKLAHFVKKYKIDVVDFDFEGASVISSQGPDANDKPVSVFFQKLHDLLTPEKRESHLTSMADVRWANQWLEPLFYDDHGEHIFHKMFHGLNLMTYSDDRYWLDPKDIGWGIEQWMDIVGKDKASLVRVGFHDQVLYADPKANGGNFHHGIAPGSTDGQAAGQIYRALQKKLVEDGYKAPLGTPFYWPSGNVQVGGRSRYSTDGDKSNFVSPQMQDFFDYLNKNP